MGAGGSGNSVPFMSRGRDLKLEGPMADILWGMGVDEGLGMSP